MSRAQIVQAMNYPRRWFYGLKFIDWLIYRLTWIAIIPLVKGPIRLRGFGHRGLPQDGPMLLLPNHFTVIDPFMAGWLPHRPSRFMASAQPLASPFLGRWLKALGAFPKKKFVKDRNSMEAVQELFDDGQLITIFPEGTRSWDGRPMPIGDGIGRLVKRLDSPVILAHMVSAHFFWPRWAHYPRFIPVHIEYEGPLRWPEDATAAEITADIARHLGRPQYIPEGYRTWGFRMAHGLPAFLWACPHCFALDALGVHPADSNHVLCGSCGADWAVTLDTRLAPATDTLPERSVAEAYDHVVEHFGERPVVDRDTFEDTGVALHGGTGTLFKARNEGRGFDAVAQGPMHLDGTGLVVGDGAAQGRLDYAHLRAVSVELGNKVQMRTEDSLYRLVPDDGSVLKWGHFIHAWRCSVQGIPRTPLG